MKKTILILKSLMIFIGVIWTMSLFTHFIVEKIDTSYRMDKEVERESDLDGRAYQDGLYWGKALGVNYSFGSLDIIISSTNEAYQYAYKYLDNTRISSKACEQSYENPIYCNEIPSDDLITFVYGKPLSKQLAVDSFHSGFVNGFVDFLMDKGVIVK